MIKAARPEWSQVCAACVGTKRLHSELTMIKLKHLTISVLRNFLQVMTSMKKIRREIL